MADNDTLELKSFSMPATATLQKGTDGKEGEWVIEGLASTNDLDQQGEVVLVKGLDLSYLDQGRGTLNWNHRGDGDPSAIVGVVTETRRTPTNELYVKGKLLKSLPKAQAVRELMTAFEQDAPDRKLGMSIEGKVLQRNGNQIVKAWVKAIALTADPVNKATWVTFAKSMSSCEWAPATDPLTSQDPIALEEAVLKSLVTAAPTSGTVRGTSPLMPESLEKDDKDTGPDGKKRGKKHKGHGHKEKMGKSLTHNEATALVKSWCPTASDHTVKRIVDFTFARLNQED